ncbi:MAG: hypothetical protein ABI459_03785, partial [Deltaproteobacteria bacterium]
HYLDQLARQAGHQLDITKLEPKEWLAASIAAHKTEYVPMERAISGLMQGAERNVTEAEMPDMAEALGKLNEMITAAREAGASEKDIQDILSEIPRGIRDDVEAETEKPVRSGLRHT